LIRRDSPTIGLFANRKGAAEPPTPTATALITRLPSLRRNLEQLDIVDPGRF
jgi:hypothetical protein